MAYYCWKCRRIHSGGAVARRHRAWAIPIRTRKQPKSIFARKLVVKKPKQPKILTPLKTVVGKVVITHKVKPLKARRPEKIVLPRKARLGLSKRRRGQLRMKTWDPHERRMLQQVRQSTGMTHVQIMNLRNLAKDHDDIIDFATLVGGTAGLSKQRIETYEFAKRKIVEKIDLKMGIDKWKFKSKGAIDSYKHAMDFEYEGWLRDQKRSRKRLI